MNFTPRAFIFDLNGTMIDDMAFHNMAWTGLLNEDLDARLSPEQVKEQMYGKNDELLIRVFGPDRFDEKEREKISLEKEKRYQAAFFPHLGLIAGLDKFLARAEAKHILMAIGSAAIPLNINFILDNLPVRKYFKAVVSADDVKESKPNPETFIKAADLLGVDYKSCVVFEDAPKGVEAALNAGMHAVVLTTMHEKEAFLEYPNIIAFIKDYNDPFMGELLG